MTRHAKRGWCGALLALGLATGGCGSDPVFDQREELRDAPRRFRVDGVELTVGFDAELGRTVVDAADPRYAITLSGPALDEFTFRLDRAERASERADAEPVVVAPESGSRGAFNSEGSKLRLDVSVRWPDGEALEIHGLGERIPDPETEP